MTQIDIFEEVEDVAVESTFPKFAGDSRLAGLSPSDQSYTFQNIMPYIEEVDEFFESATTLLGKAPLLQSGMYSNMDRHVRDAMVEAFETAYNTIRSRATGIFKSEGIDRIELPELEDRICIDLDPLRVERKDLLEYWKQLLSLRVDLRNEGLHKHADVIARNLFGWMGRRLVERIKLQKSCAIVSVTAYCDNYEWSTQYTWNARDKIMNILESLQYVILENELDDRFMTHSVNQVLERKFVVSGDKVQYCEHVELVTFKNKVRFRISHQLLEALQIFVANQGINPPEGE